MSTEESIAETVLGAVAGALSGAGVPDVYTRPPSACMCEEPVVLCWKGFEREARFPSGEERGLAVAELMTVREADAAARDTAFFCERAVRGMQRGPWNEQGEDVRFLAVDAGVPEFRGRDRSGRFVWGFEARLTVARSI